ncbi:mid1-interacting protein 1-like [Podarcis raffonei]|uniref:mid1-interacting protein 1-like n=1 Tax=Podarcis raffonei TaxID=65483 RepID=UPI0023298EF2|nr:mid1-interacting protein 1-like [Podarcis raffonei]
MERYVSAVRKMEQTVMFPSLLLGVSLEDQAGTFETNSSNGDSSERDLYEDYTLLKAIKGRAEGGLAALDFQNPSLKEEESKEKADLEDLFHYHVSGLHRVLTQLTRRANALTSKYNEIMGQINQNEISLRW